MDASTYYPQTDSLIIEIFNKTLKEMLQKMVRKEGKDCVQIVSIYFVFLLGGAPGVYRLLAFELMYRREVQGPLDVIKETWGSSQ